MIEIRCPECGSQGKIPDAAAGRKTKCPRCSAIFAVPSAAASESASEAVVADLGFPRSPASDRSSRRPRGTRDSESDPDAESAAPRSRERSGPRRKRAKPPETPKLLLTIMVIVLIGTGAIYGALGRVAYALYVTAPTPYKPPDSQLNSVPPSDSQSASDDRSNSAAASNPLSEPPKPATPQPDFVGFADPGKPDDADASADLQDPNKLGASENQTPPNSTRSNRWRIEPDGLKESPQFLEGWNQPLEVSEKTGDRGVIFPTTLSRFVMTGSQFFDDSHWAITDLQTGKVTARLVGKLALENPIVLRSDGAAILGRTQRINKGFLVVQPATGSTIGFAHAADGANHVDFGPGSTLFLLTQNFSRLEVWDYLNKRLVGEVETPRPIRHDSLALSHGGRRYLAYQMEGGRIEIVDLAIPAVAVVENSPKLRPDQEFACQGLAFSPDGERLAGVFASDGEMIIKCWRINGVVESEFRHSSSRLIKFPFGFRPESFASKLQWFPDGSAWLLNSQSIIDRVSGAQVWSLPFGRANPWETAASPRLPITGWRVVTLVKTSDLRAMAIPKAKLHKAIELARKARNPSRS